MAITLPADLEIDAFAGDVEEGCFQIEHCWLLSVPETSVSMSHQT